MGKGLGPIQLAIMAVEPGKHSIEDRAREAYPNPPLDEWKLASTRRAVRKLHKLGKFVPDGWSKVRQETQKEKGLANGCRDSNVAVAARYS